MFIPIWIILVGAALAVIGVLVVVDRLGLWAERRGWIYWRRARPEQIGRAVLGGLQQFVEPEIRHVIEAREQERATIDVVDRKKD